MKQKIILSLLLILTSTFANANVSVSKTNTLSKAVVTMYSNDIPFDVLTTGNDSGTRSMFPMVPFVVLLDENSNSIVIDFVKAVGVVEITVSQNGAVIYSSSENVQSAMQRIIDLSSEVFGNYLIEIKGENGAYAYGNFCL